jgi:PKD repeat protein
MKSLSSIFLMVLLVSGFVLVCNLNFGAAQNSTEVGGIIHSDTTWTMENSPYSVTSTVQIAENVTLKIDPGVTVTFNSTDSPMFLVHGRVEAHGTPSNKITIICIERSFFFDTAGAPSDCSVSLDYCVLKHGLGICQNIGGSLNLTNSEIIDLADPNWGDWGYSYSWGLESEIYIEHNVFIDVKGFQINWSKEKIYIRYNLFKGNNGFILDESTEFAGQSHAVVKYNTFIDMSEPILKFYVGGGEANMSATENYWGTTNTSLIDSLIIDENDAITIHGFVNYLPILTEPHPDTPTLPITASFEYSPATVYAYGKVNFDATASFAEYSQIANYRWDFGDGNLTTTSSSTIKHRYTTPNSYDVNLTVTDEFGFKNSTAATIDVLLDDVPPVTADNYNGLWHNENFNITLAATDPETGVAETYYRINNGATKTVSANGQPLITIEGANNTLEYWSFDNAANEETHKLVTGIKLDKSPPTSLINLNGTLGSAGWFTSDVTVSISATDTVSEVGRTEYNIDNSVWKTYVAPFNIADEGVFSIYYRSIDPAGNEETAKTETVKVDKTAPSGSVQINENVIYTNVTSVTLTLSANDTTSGVAQMRFSNDRTEWSSWETYATSKAWTLTADNGEKTVYVQFKDNADLVSESYQDSIILDTIKPTADGGQNQIVKVDTTVTFNANASSDNLDIISYEWEFGNGATGTGETTTCTYTNTGTYTVTLTVKDAAGNADTHQITVTVKPPEEFLPWIIVAVAAVAITVAAVAVFWKKRKSTH